MWKRSLSESASACIKMWRRALYLVVSSQDSFKVENGLRQGCPLSPLLYSIYVMGMVEKLEEGLGVKERDYWCGALLNADDILTGGVSG